MTTYNVGPFEKGLNDVDEEVNLPDGSLRKAENIDLDRKGWPRRRPGYTLLYSGTGIHSYWNGYFVENGTLKYLEVDNTATSIVSGFTKKPLSYCNINGVIHFSNEDDNGTVDGPWGIDDIDYLPTLSEIEGGLTAGTYQVSIAYVSESGEQGGASNPIIISVGDNSGIQLTNIAQSPNGYYCSVFISDPNGEELYFNTKLNPGITSFDIQEIQPDGPPLKTLFMKRVPPGQLIRQFKGRAWIAQGDTLWYSEAQRYGLYRPAKNFFRFKERITVIEPTENGIFVVSDKVYFLSGTDPKVMQLVVAGNSTGKEGTGISVDADKFDLEGVEGKVAYWYGSDGAILGLPGGQIEELSDDRVTPVGATSGCTGFKEINGLRQMITNLNNRTEKDNFGAVDNATAVVYRNGIIV